MAEIKKGGFCKSCNQQRVVFGRRPNHILHLLLSVVTGGLWLIVWILLSVGGSDWRCSECGSNKVKAVR